MAFEAAVISCHFLNCLPQFLHFVHLQYSDLVHFLLNEIYVESFLQVFLHIVGVSMCLFRGLGHLLKQSQCLCVYSSRTSLTSSVSLSSILQSMASSDGVSRILSNDSWSFVFAQKKCSLSYVRFVDTVSVVFNSFQNSANLISKIFFPGFLYAKLFWHSFPRAKYS